MTDLAYSLDQNLANPDAPANLPEASLHSLYGFIQASRKLIGDNRNHGHLSRPENRDSADLSFKPHAFVSRTLSRRSSSANHTPVDPRLRIAYRRSFNCFFNDWKMV